MNMDEANPNIHKPSPTKPTPTKPSPANTRIVPKDSVKTDLETR